MSRAATSRGTREHVAHVTLTTSTDTVRREQTLRAARSKPNRTRLLAHVQQPF